jgi:hypothetical protein
VDGKGYLKARDILVLEIRKELLGPGSEYSIPDAEHEIITDLPEVRYSIGILFPQNNRHDSDNDDTARTREVPTAIDLDEEEISFDLEVEEKDHERSEHYSGNIAEDTDVSTFDENIGLSTQSLPSSMGFTFFVEGTVDKLVFDVEFGTYRKTQLQDCKLPFTPEYEDYYIPIQFDQNVEYFKDEGLLRLKAPLSRKDVFRAYDSDNTEDGYLKDCLFRLCNQFGRGGYVREPHTIEVEVSFAEKNYLDNPDLDGKKLKLTVLKRTVGKNIFSITVMLVNTAKGGYNGTNSIFQPKLTICTEKNTSMRFCEYSKSSYKINDDEEEQSLTLLYRNKKIYATGHGTSADWDIDNFGSGKIWNDFMPMNEVPQMDFDIKDKSVDNNALSMKFLSDLDSTDKSIKIEMMETLVTSYSSWISGPMGIKEVAEKLAPKYKKRALKHVEDCIECCNRMYNGLEILKVNKTAYSVFELANRAMFMQRIHSKIQGKDHYPNDVELQDKMAALNYFTADNEHFWRPFQLAFLLMSVRSIVEPKCTERDLVDLIWFPTGGGKTEAYLGLTAFTIFYRKLSYPETSGGTAVIMRYTLRLLAAQQFVRAGTLICACELIRKDCEKTKKYPTYPLGNQQITIGLWIGGEHTPNKNNKAKERWNKLNEATAEDLRYVKDKNNKFQILKCPWCGTKLVKDVDSKGRRLIGQWGYLFRGSRFYMACPQEGCKFERSLPINVVDEELYDNPPTLLFGTVDKFAMLPWKNDVGSFFATDSTNMTPELIIQDELHLISGPLGTIVGLYEVATDALCSAKGVKPKIIASTATIRRAKEQCSALYNREVRQFPSPGIDAEDSYFAKEADMNDNPGRLYIGMMPSGKTKAMMEVRAIAAILQRVYMMDVPYEVKDKFWTLAVYFNSLRDLGKCATLIDDDVKDFIRRTVFRFGSRKGIRQIGSASELTSRVSTSQLNETLEKLERLEYSKENQDAQKYPINVLLASNMISVGVDVARLNVMLLVGQPKLTSEYIQASSRIGRTFPGVAFVLYDGAKSRDRSHFEQFKAYHESFYKFVEPTGVTPFAKSARDRAIHAVMVSMMRHIYGLSEDADAVNFDKDSDDVKKIESYILDRIREVNLRSDFEFSDETDYIKKEMSQFWHEWKERIELAGNKNFFYGDRFMVTPPIGDAKRLLKVFGSGGLDKSKETLMSMRNVDKSVAANILVWGDSE